jgi:cytochrome P450 family 142 subfamily A polypeptide 1
MAMNSTPAGRPHVNLLDPVFYVDPWAAYRWLRDEAPVFWDPVQQLWAISRYEDVVAVERDGRLYSSFFGSRPHIDQRTDESMINMDDPEHQQQRNLVVRRFTPHGARSHEDHVRAVVTQILDDVTLVGECEAIEAIASRLPAIVIGDVLGYPREHWERVRAWSEQVMFVAGQTSPQGPPHIPDPKIGPIISEFVEITSGLIKQRRSDPKDDLISVWTAQGWSTKKVLDEALLVLNGGAETTRTVTGTMIRDLARHPDQRQVLIEHPELLTTTAVDEFIRWVSPVLNMRRTATSEHQLRDRTIHQGDQLLLLYGCANRDERAFDDPEVLDVGRERANRHVAFGFGTHFCLGAHLARLELRVMFEELLRRLPDWELVDADEPQVIPATFARAYDRIRIRFTPSRSQC